MRSTRFVFRTREEATLLAGELAVVWPVREQGVLALTELFINAIVHGNRGAPDRSVRVGVAQDASGFAVTVCDDGAGFDWGTALARGGGHGLTRVVAVAHLTYNASGTCATVRPR